MKALQKVNVENRKGHKAAYGEGKHVPSQKEQKNNNKTGHR